MNENNGENRGRRDRNRRHRGGSQGRGQGQRQDGRNAGGGRDGKDARDSRGRRPESRPSKPQEPIILPTLPTPVCARCGQPIEDVTSALADKATGTPVHFDCVLSFLNGAETLGQNEKIVYVGQGRFAVMFFENPVDTRKFKIVRMIEWESRESRAEWRGEIAGLFSQVK
ncbi:MAG TPA: hypothetical protein PLU93_07150 [Treponemataceae bacterium]|nr:hypothetical protein [Treponemataceae bacterium]